MNNPSPVVSNNLVWAILSTVLCCLPLGIVSIVYAAKVDGLVAAGNIDAARNAADTAKKWAIASVLAWVVAIVLYVLLVFVFGVGSALLGGQGSSY